jgi:hypothetical protein
VARTPPSRLSSTRILRHLRDAARKGDRTALTLAVDQMRTLALSPRYWEKYLGLLRNPLARLVDLLAIKQGDRIAHQKGWKKLGAGRRPPSEASPRDRLFGQGPRSKRRPSRRRPRRPAAEQPSLFDWEAGSTASSSHHAAPR